MTVVSRALIANLAQQDAIARALGLELPRRFIEGSPEDAEYRAALARYQHEIADEEAEGSA